MQIFYEYLANLFKKDRVTIDNVIFKLHYRFTVFILVGCTLIIWLYQCLHPPIICTGDDTKKYHTTYCWIHSTFTVQDNLGKEVGVGVAYPGVRSFTGREEKKDITYYQYVYFCLCLQALLFYIPHYIWKNRCSKNLELLVQNLSLPIDDERTRREQINLLCDCFVDNLKTNNMNAWVYFCCEILNCFNVVFQSYLLNIFLGYEFVNYGSQILNHLHQNPMESVDPMERIFPKLAKCTVYEWGFSGTIQRKDLICLLALNIFTEKIYAFLWFWLIILFLLSLLAVIYRIILFCFRPIRGWSLSVGARLRDNLHINTVNKKCSVGDWFLLRLLEKNMDPVVFGEFIKRLEFILHP
ncbi:hypothetical protein QYM36_007179 [Artemia franciscana]|uniref:Innexin n=1 Tax=Artemia franciscana TaxID=6661 RepID=A0AA88I7Z3_ARTSF|nr:hypothetical protein QYM36_007179 [Artemia franciscana]